MQVWQQTGQTDIQVRLFRIAGKGGTHIVAALELSKVPVVKAGMLIRRPVADVFEAFIDPEITSRFWFSRGTGRLKSGSRVIWHWDMYGVSAQVDVREIEENRRILIEWSGGGEDSPTAVEWHFDDRSDGTTYVTITNSGFSGTGDEVCSQACDSTQGFTFVLAGLKAYLEHGVELNLVADQVPDGHVEGWEDVRDDE